LRDLELSSLGKCPHLKDFFFVEGLHYSRPSIAGISKKAKSQEFRFNGQASSLMCFFNKILELKSFCVLELDGYLVVDRGATYS